MPTFNSAAPNPTRANFPPTSRYHAVEVVTVTGDGSGAGSGGDDAPHACLRRRFVPPASRFALLHLYRVGDGERLDRISARELGDPLAFWRLCDANDANASMRPAELTEVVGRELRITLPEGIPGMPRAAGD